MSNSNSPPAEPGVYLKEIIKVSAPSEEEEKINRRVGRDRRDRKWNSGILESWNDKENMRLLLALYSNIPSFQFSSVFLCVLRDLCG